MNDILILAKHKEINTLANYISIMGINSWQLNDIICQTEDSQKFLNSIRIEEIRNLWFKKAVLEDFQIFTILIIVV